MVKYNSFCGIDYGSKLAGTTVIAFVEVKNFEVQLFSSQKNEDADAFVLEHTQRLKPSFVFLDAPLSLPLAYKKSPPEGDFFYRKADKLVSAMSPMFLGGLTARAMKLACELAKKNIEVFEGYPARVAKILDLKDLDYKKTKEALPKNLVALANKCPLKLPKDLQTWHQFDALLALYSAYRYFLGEAESFGDAQEGLIWV